MSNTDFRQRFVFDNIDARGCYVRLQNTVSQIQATHYYPDNLAVVLNQFALAAVLLRDSIKINGAITIQLRSRGAIKLIMADCLDDGRVRAIAEYESKTLVADAQLDLSAMHAGAVLAITITPDEGERYQSIVPIEQPDLQGCLEEFFARSEQLPSWFSLNADRESAVGIALHALPQQVVHGNSRHEAGFAALESLLKTVQLPEALSSTSGELLSRLFHDQSCRLFASMALQFGCICSAQKSLQAIRSLGEKDVRELVDEQKQQGHDTLVVDCHFCFQRYEFDIEQLELFG